MKTVKGEAHLSASGKGNISATGENFADEPPDFDQKHKVPTQNLEWCHEDVRDLRRLVWRAPVAFALASIAGSASFQGGLAIVNHTGDGAIPTVDYILLVVGAIAAVILLVVGIFALADNYSSVDKAARRLEKLRY